MSQWIRGFYWSSRSSGSCGHFTSTTSLCFMHFFFEKLIQPRCCIFHPPLRALPLGDWMSEEGSAVDVIRTLHCSRELKSMNYSHLVHILLSNNTIIMIYIYIHYSICHIYHYWSIFNSFNYDYCIILYILACMKCKAVISSVHINHMHELYIKWFLAFTLESILTLDCLFRSRTCCRPQTWFTSPKHDCENWLPKITQFLQKVATSFTHEGTNCEA